MNGEQRIVLVVQEELIEDKKYQRKKGSSGKQTNNAPLFHVTKCDNGEALIAPEDNKDLRFFWGQSQSRVEDREAGGGGGSSSKEEAIKFTSWHTSPECTLPQIMDSSVRHYLSDSLTHGESLLLVSNGHDPATEWAPIIEMFEDVVTAKARAAGVFSLSGGLPSLASRRCSMDFLFSRRASAFGAVTQPTCRVSCFEVTKENALKDLTTARPVMSTDIGRRRKDGVDIRRIADISTTISNALRRRSESSHAVIIITVGTLVAELALLNSPAAPFNLDVSRRTKGGVNTHIFTLLSVLKEIAAAENARNTGGDASGKAHSIRSYRNSVLTNLLFSPFRTTPGGCSGVKVAVFCKIVNSCAQEDSARNMLHFAMNVQNCADICAVSATNAENNACGRPGAVRKPVRVHKKYMITMAGVRLRKTAKRGAAFGKAVTSEPPRKNAKLNEKEIKALKDEVELLRKEVTIAKAKQAQLQKEFDTVLADKINSMNDLPAEEWKVAITKAISDFKLKNF